MKIIIFILASISLSAVEWQRADIPGERLRIFDAFTINNELIVQNTSNPPHSFIFKNENWSSLNDEFLDSLDRFKIIAQLDSKIFISTKERNYYSIDSGKKWFETDGPISTKGTMSNKYYFGSGLNRKLFKFSFDNNKWSLATFTNDSNKLDTLVGDLIKCEGDLLTSSEWAAFPLAEPGIRISTDGGETWYQSPSFNKLIITMEIADGVIYAMATDNKLYSSEDNGMTWQVANSEELTISELVSYKDNLYSRMNKAVYKSTDNGNTWEMFVNGVEDFVIENIKVVGGKLFLLTERSQLYIYSEANEKWEYHPFLQDKLTCRDLVERNDTLYALGNRRGVIYSVDGGLSWNIFNEQFSKYFEHFSELHINDDSIVLDNYGQELYISDDRGDTWTKSNIGYFDPFDPPINKIILEDDRIILTTNTGLKVSTNKGEDWINHYGGELGEEEKIGSMFVLDSTYYSYKKTGIITSPSTLDSWDYIVDSTKTSELSIYYILDYTEDNTIYFNSEVFSDRNSVYSYSFDTGKKELFCDYPNKDTVPHLLQKVESSYIMAYGSSVIVSHDEGNNWIEHKLDIFGPDSLRGNIINGLIIENNSLLASTSDGIAYAKLSEFGITTSVENEIERNYLYTFPPYPNPASSEIKVLTYWDINLPMRESDVSVYDLSGRKVDTKGKINIVKQADHYGRITWDCSVEKTGIYIITIKHGTEEKAVKVVVE